MHDSEGDPIYWRWEAAARFITDSADMEAPVDLLALADAWTIDVLVSSTTAFRRGAIRVRPNATPEELAHELGHWALALSGVPDSEDGADWCARALMLPDRQFKRLLRTTSWDLDAIAEQCDVEVEQVARRLVDVRSSVVTALDGDRILWRKKSPWLDWRGHSSRRLSAVEGAALRGDDVSGIRVAGRRPLVVARAV